MDSTETRKQVEATFTKPFNEGIFRTFSKNLLQDLDESKEQTFSGAYIKDAFKPHITSYKRLGSYIDANKETLDVLTVKLTDFRKLDSARTMQRNFVSDYLKTRGEKDSAIVAFYNEDYGDWRFSYVRMEYKIEMSEKGQIKVKEELTPARRYSFLVGKNEPNHTAQQQIAPLLGSNKKLSLSEIEDAFNIESITKEFFNKYKDLFLKLKDEIDDILEKDSEINQDFERHEISTANFAKKLMGQIVFLYFVQKKGWMGVSENAKWGEGDKKFLQTLFKNCKSKGKNFFNDCLEPLFYDALNNENRGTDDPSYHPLFKCKIPFLNGGLFEPMNDYDWKNTELRIENDIFAKIFKTFALYNFTVREDEPLDKEVAVDPEMLGKVFENLLEVTDRKSKGAFYTPREIVHYMCQESLQNYLDTKLNDGSERVSRQDIKEFIHRGDIYIDYALRNEARRDEGKKITGVYKERELPSSIVDNSVEIDSLLHEIKICDPAIGSGAFPLGMMNEIVRARYALSAYGEPDPDRNLYNFKRQCIQDCIYGVDIDSGAIDIAKLRLWLSLIVDEEDFSSIQPLPNLDYKIMCGNSLIGVDLEDMFMKARLPEIEELKQQYFDENNRDKKQKLHNQIDDILFEVTGQRKCFDFEIHFSEVFNNNSGFDIVIGNPPYVQIKQIPWNDRKKFEKKYFSAVGRFNLFYFFLEIASSIAQTGGISCFIIPDRLLLNTQCKGLREWLLNKQQIVEMDSFDKAVFESAVVDNIIIMYKNHSKTYDHIQANSKVSLSALCKAVSKPIPLKYFHDSPNKQFDLNYDPIKSKLLCKIRIKSMPLGDIAEIKDGIIQGKVADHLFLDAPIDESSKPLLFGVNVTRFNISFGEKWVNYKTDEMMSLEVERRGHGVRHGLWMRIPKIFERDKILTRQTADEIIAVFDGDNYYYSNTLHGTTITNDNFDKFYVLGVLNSKLITWYYRTTTAEEGKVFAQIKIALLRMLPIKDIIKEKQKNVIAIVNKLINKASSLDDNDIEEFNKYRNELDSIIYKLYDLTAEEIAIVEDSAK